MSPDGDGPCTLGLKLARTDAASNTWGSALSAATAAFDDGRVTELKAGDLFYIPPIPHDSWVIGDQQYVSLHFLGFAESYASR